MYEIKVSYRTWSKGRVEKTVQVAVPDAVRAKLGNDEKWVARTAEKMAIGKVIRTRDAFDVATKILGRQVGKTAGTGPAG